MSVIGDIAFLVNDNFEMPLNKQIENMLGITADESQIYTIKDLGKISSNTFTVSTEGLYIPFEHKLKINCEGTIYIQGTSVGKVTITNSQVRTVTYSPQVYKNGVIVGSLGSQSLTNSDTTGTGGSKTVAVSTKTTNNLLLPVQKGDEITVSGYFRTVGEQIFTEFEDVDVSATISIYARAVILGTNFITLK